MSWRAPYRFFWRYLQVGFGAGAAGCTLAGIVAMYAGNWVKGIIEVVVAAFLVRIVLWIGRELGKPSHESKLV